MLQHIKFNQLGQEAQRLFHGRGHAYKGYEHVCVDWFNPAALITLYQAEDEQTVQHWAVELSQQILACEAVYVQYRYLPQAPVDCLHGSPLSNLVAVESSLKYHISLEKNQNMGLFLDMKNGRDWVRQHAENKKVLNLFAYTCGFSVAALAGGAEKVVNFDMSRSALTIGRNNHRLNHQDTKRVVFESMDIFKSFGRIKKHGPYDLLICDPPSFQKGSVDIKRDYKKIISRVPQFMLPNSWLMFCLNSPDLSMRFLTDEIQSHCPECVIKDELSAPEVFVEAQEKGLKILLCQYLP